MISLSAKIRKNIKKDLNELREAKEIPAVLYGPEIKENINLKISLKEFSKIYEEAGESSLVSIKIGGEKDGFLVLIHDIQVGPLSGKPIHVDFYQPLLKEKTEVTVPIILEGESPAVKNAGGTLVRNISEIEIEALPQNLPKEIKVNIKKLATFDDVILVKDLQIPEGAEVLREPDEILISVSPPENVEKEMESGVPEEKVPAAAEEDSREQKDQKTEVKKEQQEKQKKKGDSK